MTRTDWRRTRLAVRYLLIVVFALFAVATPFYVGMARSPLTVTGAIISSVLCLLIALAIWWI